MIPYYEHKQNKLYFWQTNHLSARPHLHRHVEMILVHEGSTSATVDTETYLLSEGDVLFVFPNKIHSYKDIDLRRVSIAVFDPDFVTAYHHTFRKYQPEHPVLVGGLARGNATDIVNLLLAERAEDALPGKEVRKAGYLSVLLGLLMPVLPMQSTRAESRDLLPRVLAYCMEHYSETITLDKVAEALHISKYYISHLLNGKLHMRFNTYLNAIRISEAMVLMADHTHSITDIAMQTGFDSLRTFDRAFCAQMGMSPRAWRSGNRKK